MYGRLWCNEWVDHWSTALHPGIWVDLLIIKFLRLNINEDANTNNEMGIDYT